MPKCREDGSFEPTQCHQRDSKNYCWCVDENGVEISHTKTHLGKPNCTRCKYDMSNRILLCFMFRCVSGPFEAP